MSIDKLCDCGTDHQAAFSEGLAQARRYQHYQQSREQRRLRLAPPWN
ncbi:hypothetical protein M2238_005294 [Bradyrhizobium elkanii]|nr:hypothetical protein [Bradyrhizobium elkanii]MCS3887062.1 hypothetical protein [Bradyrhizobium elkanii]MCW2231169.1 hypothetical protein [Bradyrhizobium elkanii]